MDTEERDYAAILKHLEGDAGPDECAEINRRLVSEPFMKKLLQFATEIRSEQGKIEYRSLRGSVHELVQKQISDMKRSKGSASQNAITIYDSRLLPLPDGVRSATVDTRRLRYRAGDFELSLSAYPVSTDSYELIGQLTSGECDQPLIAEVKVGKKRISAQANRFRVFRFPRIEIGKCRLSLKTDQVMIVAVDIDL